MLRRHLRLFRKCLESYRPFHNKIIADLKVFYVFSPSSCKVLQASNMAWILRTED